MTGSDSNSTIKAFLSLEGSATLTRSLALRRSLSRWQSLQQAGIDSGHHLVHWILNQLSAISAVCRHQVLGDPELAVWLNKLAVGERCLSSELAVVGLIASFNEFKTSFDHRLDGSLAFKFQPVGPFLLEGDGDLLNNVRLQCSAGRLIITATREDGDTLNYDLAYGGGRMETQRATLRQSFGNGAWEIVDGWPNLDDSFDDGNQSISFTASEREEFRAVLEQSWKLIGLVFPHALEEMTDTARYLSPLQPPIGGEGIPSFSSPSIPGVIFIGTHDSYGRLLDAGHLAESCLHEHLHNRLYLLDAASPLILPSDSPGSYYSPWKKTNRPADGLLHALYVFSHLALFWDRVGKAGEPSIKARALELRDAQLKPLREALQDTSFTKELSSTGCLVFDHCLMLAKALNGEKPNGL